MDDNTIFTPLISVTRSDAKAVLNALSENDIVPEIASSLIASPDIDIVTISVRKSQLVRAVSIIQSMLAPAAFSLSSSSGLRSVILIPVDFTPKSILACRVGFDLARRLNSHPVILHTYVQRTIESTFNLSDAIAHESETLVSHDSIVKMEKLKTENFEKTVKAYQAQGKLLHIPFSSVLLPGVPENVIRDYTRSNDTKIIVMSTRDSHKKAEELVGSVTAEVLDSCRVPLFTVPENSDCPDIKSIQRLAFFCNLDRQDMLSMETFLAIFGYPEVEITLIPVNGCSSPKAKEKADKLLNFCKATYPSASFTLKNFPAQTSRQDLARYIDEEDIQLLIVQNKKKNIFARILNPGLAHILFFERDMPMIVIPV